MGTRARKNKSLRKNLKWYQILRILSISLIIISLCLGFIFWTIEQKVLFSVFEGIAFALLVSFLVVDEIFFNKLSNYFFFNIYEVSNDNFTALSERRFDLQKIQNDRGYYEIDVTNKTIDNLIDAYKGIILSSDKINVNTLQLGYYDSSLKLVDYECFVQNINYFINGSKSFRTSFIEITAENVSFENKEVLEKICQLTRDTFSEDRVILSYKNEIQLVAFVINVGASSTFMYQCRVIVESFNQMNFLSKGKKIGSIRISVVSYPFSDVNDIIADLNICDNKNVEGVYGYFPNNIMSKKLSLRSEDEKRNLFNEIVYKLTIVKENEADSFVLQEQIFSNLNLCVDVFEFDFGGFVAKDYGRGYILKDNYSSENGRVKEKEGTIDNFDDIMTLAKYTDKDNTFTFYERERTVPEVRTILNKYNLQSGFFFFFYRDGALLGMIYFVNQKSKFVISSFDRESLTYICTLYRFFYINSISSQYIKEINVMLDTVLKGSNKEIFFLNKDNYRIEHSSIGFKEMFPNANEKRPLCYKALFGLDAPCKDCFIKTSQPKHFKVNENNFRVYPINIDNNDYRIIGVVDAMDSDSYGRNRFDPDLLIYSFYSLKIYLSNAFISGSKGSLLFVRLDNQTSILRKAGEDQFQYMMKDIIHRLDLVSLSAKCFMYKGDTLCFMFNEEGSSRVYDYMEIINHVVKHRYNFNNQQIQILPTLFMVNYPQDFTNTDALFRYVETNINKVPSSAENKLYLVDSGASRFASRSKYTFQLLEKAAKNNNFELSARLIVHADNAKTYGAAIIINLKDDLRATYIPRNTFEEIVTVNNERNRLTNNLIQQLGGYYITLGNFLYRSTGLERFIIYTDHDYFETKDYLDALINIKKRFLFSNNFLTFAINENDIARFQDLYKRLNKELEPLAVPLIVTNFTDTAIKVADLAALGFNEIRIDASLVRDIVYDQNAYDVLFKICDKAKAYNMSVTICGVDTNEQHEKIKGLPVNYLEGAIFNGVMPFDDFHRFIKTYNR